MKRAILTIVAVLALAACSGGGGGDAKAGTTTTTSATTTTTSSTTTASAPQPGPAAFLEWAKASEMGDRDMSAATDEQLLSVGNQGCDLMDAAPSFGWAVAELGKNLKEMGATTEQIETLLRNSVENLCPQYNGLIP